MSFVESIQSRSAVYRLEIVLRNKSYCIQNKVKLKAFGIIPTEFLKETIKDVFLFIKKKKGCSEISW